VKKSELQQKTVADLRDMASSIGLRGTSRLRKADLIAVILNAGKRGSRARPAGRSTSKPTGTTRVVKKEKLSKKAAPKKSGTAQAGSKSSSGARKGASAKKLAAKKPAAKKPVAKKPVAKRATPKKSAAPKASKRLKPARKPRAADVPPTDGAQGGSTLSPRTSKAFAAFHERGEQKVRASKYYLAPHETPELDTDFEFPVTYGDNRIALMVRDPYWLFSYWEFAADLEAELIERLGEETVAKSRLTLRVYDVTDATPETASGWHDIEVAAGARNWYINVMRVERDYCVDIGLLTPDGRFILIARSNRVSLPPVGPSDVIDEEWVVVEALDGLFRESGPGGPTSGSGGWGSGGLRS
jgi:hypothetical protein